MTRSHGNTIWPRDGRAAMAALAAGFPSMRGVPGTSPWDVEQLIEWSNSGAPTSGSIWAARFLLSVWNPSTNWHEFGLPGAGKFDLHEAWSCWDNPHRAAACVHPPDRRWAQWRKPIDFLDVIYAAGAAAGSAAVDTG